MGKVINLFDNTEDEGMEVLEPIKRYKIDRNGPCPCGSGKKYKKCCYTIQPKHPIDYYFQQLAEEEDETKWIDICLEAHESYPMEPAFFLTAATHYFQTGQFEESLVILKKAWTIMRSDLEDTLIYSLTSLLFEEGEFDEASQILEEVLAEKKETSILVMAYCDSLQAQGEYKEALHKIDEWLQNNPKDTQIIIYKLEKYIELDDLLEVFKCWKEYFDLLTTEVWIEENAQDIYNYLRRRLTDTTRLSDTASPEQIKKALDKTITIFTEINQLTKLVNKGKSEAILKKLAKIEKALPDSSELMLMVLSIYELISEYTKAFELAKKLEPHFKDDPRFFEVFARVNLGVNELDAALLYIEKAFRQRLENTEDEFADGFEGGFEEWPIVGTYLKVLLEQNNLPALEQFLVEVENLIHPDRSLISVLLEAMDESEYGESKPLLLQTLKRISKPQIDRAELYTHIVYELLPAVEALRVLSTPTNEAAKVALQKELAEIPVLKSPLIRLARLESGLIPEDKIPAELENLLGTPSTFDYDVEAKYHAILHFADPQLILDNALAEEMLDESDVQFYRFVAHCLLGNDEEVNESFRPLLVEYVLNYGDTYELFHRFAYFLPLQKISELIDTLGLDKKDAEVYKDTVMSFFMESSEME